MNAADLLAMLEAHYCPPGRQPAGLFAAEVGSPDGRRRADALWMPLVSSAGDELVGHEIKVSRADVLVELQEPAKCDPWFRYCHRWWLVVADPDLISGLTDQIPATWGIMSPPSGRRRRSMTILRPAPALKPENPAPAIQRLLAWHYYRSRDLIFTAQQQRDYAQRDADRARTSLDNLRSSGDAQVSPHGRRALELITAVDKLAAKEHAWSDETDRDDLIARAVVDRLVVERGTQEAARRLQNLVDQIRDPLAYAAKNVKDALHVLARPTLDA